MAKIFTKTGDRGETGLVGGQRVSKNDPRIEAYGTVDELNSSLGLAIALAREAKVLDLAADLERVQHWLFDLGSLLAALPEDRSRYKLREIAPASVSWLEARIDFMTASLPKLTHFILPGGSSAVGAIHVARTVSRRAERLVIGLGASEPPANAVIFLNRLSDYLFVAARYCAKAQGVSEVAWAAV